jgi:hypothetical protein
MTNTEFCRTAGLTERELQNRIDHGLLEAQKVGRTSLGGARREFTADQAERARLIKVLHQKGVSLARLAPCNLNFDRQAYAVYDGRELPACGDVYGGRSGQGETSLFGCRSVRDPHGHF